MSQEINNPLYKLLNEQRTQGDWHIGLMEHRNDFGLAQKKIFIESPIPSQERRVAHIFSGKNKTNIVECDANAKYVALAVNNLHHLAEALEYIANWDSFKEHPIGRIAKEALTRIS